MTANSKIPIEIDIQTDNILKKKNINVYYDGIKKDFNIQNDKETFFNELLLEDQEYIRSFCKEQFEKDLSWSYLNCYKMTISRINHKKIHPNIFSVLDTIEYKINENLIYATSTNKQKGITKLFCRNQNRQQKHDSVKYLFRMDDKGLDITDNNFMDKKLSQLCTLVKRYIVTSLDGLFSNVVSHKLIKSYRNNHMEYEVLLSYIPFILDEDETRLLSKLFNIFKTIDLNREYTHMTMSGLLKLFSLVLFDSKCFTSLEVLNTVENILTDISILNFQKIPKTVIKKIMRFV